MAPCPANSKPRAAILAGLVLSLLAIGSGCERKAETPLPPPDQSYTTRGRVEGLPDAQDANIRIMHERIPDFVSREGNVIGMNAMPMPFEPAKGLSLEGIEIGDKVEFTFEVRWKTRPFSRLVAITELPPDTELDFSRPSGGH
jgi:Cu/Ag efflux protein CusF